VIGTARSAPAVDRPGRVRRTAQSITSLREKRGRRLLYIRLILILGLLFVGYLAITFIQVWVTSRHDGAREADAVVVLGAAQYDGRPSPVFKERLDHAFEIYDEGLVKVVVITGGKQAGDRFTEAYTGYTYLRDKGIPEQALLTEVQGRNTWESIAAAARILRDRDMTAAVMVTDGYHALRVNAIADELGLDASVSPSHPGGSLQDLVKETGAVALGRIVGFRRLVNIDDKLERRIVTEDSTGSVSQPLVLSR
jgi:vancomycin permeability regulator SanA